MHNSESAHRTPCVYTMKSVVLGRKPTCAVQLDCNLEELRRVQDLESLRGYLVRENCFPTQKDAHTARYCVLIWIIC